MPDPTYQTALDDFTRQLRGFYSAPEGIEAVEGAIRGGEIQLPTDVLATRAENLVEASGRLGNLTAGYLEASESHMLGAAVIDPASARKGLQESVQRSLVNISGTASQVSSLGLETLFSLDDTLLIKGVGLVSQDLADLVDHVVKGFNALVSRLATVAMRLLLQAYDWVLALIGKDGEQAARQKVQEWVDQLRQGHLKAGDEKFLASQLVEQIYDTKAINDLVNQWLASSQADASVMTQTAGVVNGLSAH
jgi:hypothetical protein